MGTPLPIEAATIGWADSLILMVLALVVLGPRKLPELGRQVGKLMYEFRKASNDFKYQMEEELRSAEDADRRKREAEERDRQLALNPPAAEPAAGSAPATEAPAAAGPAATAESAPAAPSDPYAGYTEFVKEQERLATEHGQPVPSDETAAALAATLGEDAAPAAHQTVDASQTPAAGSHAEQAKENG